jgi:serine/threonine-protein kinase
MPKVTQPRIVVSSDALLGTTLADRYFICNRLGGGGMGDVYIALHVGISRRVVVKVLKHETVQNQPEAVERFRREAQAAATTGHPNIIEVFDFVSTNDGRVAIVMEYLSGSSLEGVLAKGALEPARAVRIALQVSRAMTAAHGAGIVHRDLKPDNVFLVDREDEPDYVKVLDFGIAAHLTSFTDPKSRLTQPGITIGTPEFMAPEQFAGMAVDGRADIYSLGAILYLALTGCPPHMGSTPLELLRAKLTEVPALPSRYVRRIPPELDELLLEMLDNDPPRRPPGMAEVKDRLVAIERLLAQSASVAEDAHTAVMDPETLTEAMPAAPASVERDDQEYVAEMVAKGKPGRSIGRVAVLVAASTLAAAVVVGALLSREPQRAQVQPVTEEEAAPRPAEAAPVAEATAPSPIVVPVAATAPTPPREKPPKVAPKKEASAPAARVPTAPTAPAGGEWLREAKVLQAEGRLAEAEKAFFRASTSGDRAAAAGGALGLAQLALSRRHYADVVRQARRSLTLGADPGRAWRMIAEAKCGLGDAAGTAEANAMIEQHGGKVVPCEL